MPFDPNTAVIVFGLASAIAYGIGDFSAGYASRGSRVLTVLLISQFFGLVGLFLLAMIFGETSLTPHDFAVGAGAGVIGLIGLFGLYRGLAMGQMSIVAPITAVLSTAIPVLFSAVTQSLPSPLQIVGFVLAVLGVYFISRPPADSVKPSLTALVLAVIGGTGFGVFYVLLAQIQEAVVFLPLVAARLTSVTLMIIAVLSQSRFNQQWFVRPVRRVLPIIAIAGVMDAAGNALFVLAEQSGRLDIASVLASLYPVATVVLAFLLLRERLTRWQAFGMLIVFAALPLIAYQPVTQ
jgi:drug/metabolite transporter (DMT)-like permease